MRSQQSRVSYGARTGRDDTGLGRGGPRRDEQEVAGQEEGHAGSRAPVPAQRHLNQLPSPLGSPQEEQFTSSLAYDIIFALGL